jgi:hypothetical protein
VKLKEFAMELMEVEEEALQRFGSFGTVFIFLFLKELLHVS